MIPLSLHIGTPKTATTSIQESLWLNHDVLARSGLLYCHTLGRTNNIDLFLACLHPGEQGFGILENRGIIGDQQRNLFQSDVIRRLSESALHIESTPSLQRLVSSSEHFWFLWSDVHFQNLKHILGEAGVYIDRIIVYFRSQSDLLYSALSTMVRDGYCRSDVDAATLGSHELQYLDYYSRLILWRQNFPEAAMHPFLFNDHKKDILSHFYSVCSCKSESLVPSPVMNESLCDIGISLMSELNRRFFSDMGRPEIVKLLSTENPRTVLGRLVEKCFPGKPIPTPATVQAINSFYQTSNVRLVDQFFPGRQLDDLCPCPLSVDSYHESGLDHESIGKLVTLLIEALKYPAISPESVSA
ncbi:hypothetical protein VB738_13470 [Cyanobium gracile UHCC 0139]|uniref:Sulfotransferase domain-containing protein n=1 Tax=Cyanobium gracile UHCC 0139 TaxID=3110308 RepID=A0ABU5RWY5_9CYAN|nr:hypothetical protein [Cyanobium gracile]MEA5392267.1 hypothetical protein [Cyanobium gracile UHCC 0139]